MLQAKTKNMAKTKNTPRLMDCPLCTFQTSNKTIMAEHFVQCGKTNQEKKKCPHCQYKANTLYGINRHINKNHKKEEDVQVPRPAEIQSTEKLSAEKVMTIDTDEEWQNSPAVSVGEEIDSSSSEESTHEEEEPMVKDTEKPKVVLDESPKQGPSNIKATLKEQCTELYACTALFSGRNVRKPTEPSLCIPKRKIDINPITNLNTGTEIKKPEGMKLYKRKTKKVVTYEEKGKSVVEVTREYHK